MDQLDQKSEHFQNVEIENALLVDENDINSTDYNIKTSVKNHKTTAEQEITDDFLELFLKLNKKRGTSRWTQQDQESWEFILPAPSVQNFIEEEQKRRKAQ